MDSITSGSPFSAISFYIYCQAGLTSHGLWITPTGQYSIESKIEEEAIRSIKLELMWN